LNTRTAGRELAFLAIGQLSQSSELSPDKMILAATRTLRDFAKSHLKKVRKDITKLGDFFFHEELDQQADPQKELDWKNIQDSVSRLETAAFEVQEALDLVELLNQDDNAHRYASSLIQAYRANRESIDSMLAQTLESNKVADGKSWSAERVLAVDRTVLKIAITELSFFKGAPAVVVIDEAMKLSEKYGTEESPKFVNGVLADFVKNVT